MQKIFHTSQKYFLSFGVILLALFSASSVFAQNPPATPVAPAAPPVSSTGAPLCDIGGGVYLETCTITESMNKVTAYFYGYGPNSDNPAEEGLYFCYKSNQEKCNGDDFKSVKTKGNIIKEEVCGDGDDKLMGTSNKRGSGCKDSDYFFQGKTYVLGLYNKKDKNSWLGEASFYIGHFAPTINIDSNNNYIDPSSITVTIQGRREHENENGDKQNNYKVSIEGKDLSYSKSQCVIVKNLSGTHQGTVTFNGVKKGSYVVKIQEQIDDDSGCKGGFTYAQSSVTIGDTTHPGKKGTLIRDPNQVESRQQSNAGVNLPPPCAKEDQSPDGQQCLAIKTSLGKINVVPEQFVGSLFKIFLSAASISGFIIFLYAGYKILTSGGNKEKVGEAREQIKAVILGILFIVISLVILETLGVDILKIPGFNR